MNYYSLPLVAVPRVYIYDYDVVATSAIYEPKKHKLKGYEKQRRK